MSMQVHDYANKISTIPRECHPAAITQMVMDGLRCPLGDATQSEHSQMPCLLVIIIFYLHCIYNYTQTAPPLFSMLLWGEPEQARIIVIL